MDPISSPGQDGSAESDTHDVDEYIAKGSNQAQPPLLQPHMTLPPPAAPLIAPQVSSVPVSPISQILPADKAELTIKNLDTGEEFIIGENDPDFDFDTFEIGCGPAWVMGDAGEVEDGDGEGEGQ